MSRRPGVDLDISCARKYLLVSTRPKIGKVVDSVRSLGNRFISVITQIEEILLTKMHCKANSNHRISYHKVVSSPTHPDLSRIERLLREKVVFQKNTIRRFRQVPTKLILVFSDVRDTAVLRFYKMLTLVIAIK